MLFNSYEFIALFLPITVLVFYLLGKYTSNQYAILWLVSASLFFYAWWNPAYLILISTSIIINFYIGHRITVLNSEGQGKKSYQYLVIGLLFNLTLLGYFKYSYFFISTANDLLESNWVFYNVVLPIGISFFTLQQIAYLIDAKRNETCEHSFFHYSLFVLFFPQLIAGPIVHHKQILPQFLNMDMAQPIFKNIVIGFSIFIIGLFKKVLLADNLALYVNPVFSMAEAGQPISFFQAWIGVLAYSLQLYFDFSAYSDMAIGLARMFGVVLPLNFYSPYKAASIIEFWKRWHITLSCFLRDYVYIPLGGNKKGNLRRYINIMLTMLIGGLWHGAAWGFVVWGLMHGFYLVINHIWRLIRGSGEYGFWGTLVSRALTFLAVALAWVVFRSESFDASIEIYKGLVNIQSVFIDEPLKDHYRYRMIFSHYIDIENIKIIVLLICFVFILWLLPNTQEIFSKYHPYQNDVKFSNELDNNRFYQHIKWQPSMLWAVLLSVLFIISLMSLSKVSEFLYFQF